MADERGTGINQAGDDPGESRAEITSPGVDNSGVSCQDVIRPGVDDSGVSRPEASCPDADDSGESRADVTRPGVDDSGVSHSGAANSSVVSIGAASPGATHPGEAAPSTSGPAPFRTSRPSPPPAANYSLSPLTSLYPPVPRQIRLHGGGQSYLVCRDGEPWLLAEVPACGWNRAFNTAQIFGGFLCIGAGSVMYMISIETGAAREFAMDLYFGYFYQHGGRLYAASESRVYCFDGTGGLVWKTPCLAVDGVVIQGVYQGVMRISCEQDPPGGWTDCGISLKDGTRIQEP